MLSRMWHIQVWLYQWLAEPLATSIVSRWLAWCCWFTYVWSALLFTAVSLSSVQDWLSRYGYLPPADPRTSKLQTKDGLEKAIRVMQRFGGVQETGVLGNNQKLYLRFHKPGSHMRSLPVIFCWLHTMWCSSLSDQETLKLMSTPRCSLPDIVGSEDMLRRRRRRKRYALSGLKWHKTDLTWRYSMFPVMLHCGFISCLYES